MMRSLLLGAGLAVGAFVAIIAVELVFLARREYLPADPRYVVDERVEPAAGVGAPPLRLVVLGDSTVVGVGSPDEAQSLPVLIARRVADALGRPVEVMGHGRSGARTAAVASEQLPMISGTPDVIVIVIGSNDATHATFWPRLRRQTDEMLRQARALGAPVVLAGTPRFNGTEFIPQPLRAMLDRYSTVLRGEQRAAASEVDGVRFVDLAAEASPRFSGVPEATSSDGFHPSPIGYGFWADAIAPAVIASIEADH